MPTATPGMPLPAFDLVSDSGRIAPVLQELAGRAAVVHLMRSSSCPVCLAHAAALQRMRDEGALGDAAIVLIAPGGVDEARDARARSTRRSASAVVFASATAHDALGLGTVALLQQSATLVIDAAGTIRSMRTSTLPTGSFSPDDVRQAMTAIRLADGSDVPSV